MLRLPWSHQAKRGNFNKFSIFHHASQLNHISGVPAEITLDCDDDQELGEPVFGDSCDTVLDIQYTPTVLSGTLCEYDLERKWVATDDCDNSTED